MAAQPAVTDDSVYPLTTCKGHDCEQRSQSEQTWSDPIHAFTVVPTTLSEMLYHVLLLTVYEPDVRIEPELSTLRLLASDQICLSTEMLK